MKNKITKYEFPDLNTQLMIQQEKEALCKKIREIGKTNSEYLSNKYLFPTIKNVNSCNTYKKCKSNDDQRRNISLLEKLVQISTRPLSKEYVIENHSPLKKSRGFKLINQVMNINLENTRIMSKIMEKNSNLNKNKMKTDYKKHKVLSKRLEKFEKKGDSIKLKTKLKDNLKSKDNSFNNDLKTFPSINKEKIKPHSAKLNEIQQKVYVINKNYYELAERKRWEEEEKAKINRKRKIFSADKKPNQKKSQENKSLNGKNNQNDLENLLELYEKTYINEIEKLETNNKDGKKSIPSHNNLKKINKSFYEGEKAKNNEVIDENFEELDFSFTEIKLPKKILKRGTLEKSPKNKKASFLNERHSIIHQPSHSEINIGKEQDLSKRRITKYNSSCDEVWPKLKKKGKSCADYADKENYFVVSEDVLEIVEVMKKRKFSV